MNRENRIGILAAIVGNGIFGFSFMFSRIALGIATPFVMLMYRFILAFVLLALIALWSARFRKPAAQQGTQGRHQQHHTVVPKQGRQSHGCHCQGPRCNHPGEMPEGQPQAIGQQSAHGIGEPGQQRKRAGGHRDRDHQQYQVHDTHRIPHRAAHSGSRCKKLIARAQQDRQQQKYHRGANAGLQILAKGREKITVRSRLLMTQALGATVIQRG